MLAVMEGPGLIEDNNISKSTNKYTMVILYYLIFWQWDSVQHLHN